MRKITRFGWTGIGAAAVLAVKLAMAQHPVSVAPMPAGGGGDDGAVVDDVKVTILDDMVVNRWTHGEWGFSALVEVTIGGETRRILFDTGAEPGTVQFNAKRINKTMTEQSTGQVVTPSGIVELCKADTVVLSHNHQDHTMGLVALRELCSKTNRDALKTAYVGSDEIFYPRPYQPGDTTSGRQDDNVFVPGNGISKWLGVDARYERGITALYKQAGGKFITAGSKPVELMPGVWVTGKIPRDPSHDEHTYPVTPRYVPPGAAAGTDDDVPEEQALVIRTAKGIVVITGCAHAGLVNTLSYASSQLGQGRPVLALIGGFHLLSMKLGDGTTPGTASWDAANVKPFGIQYLLGAHCTGLERLKYLRDQLGLPVANALSSSVGAVFWYSKGPQLSVPAPAINLPIPQSL